MHIEIISCTQSEAWNAVLERCYRYDFYHLAQYHLLHKKEGQGVLIVVSEGNKVIAFPLLIWPLANEKGLAALTGYFDATSVYGYAGPITNVECTDIEFLERANQALSETLAQQKIITAFSRLHPILNNHCCLLVGETVPLGMTVSIDLAVPDEEQFRSYRKNHQRDIKKALCNNITCFDDADWLRYLDFIRLYYVTMQRVGAEDRYFFSRDYFDGLRAALGSQLRLFVAVQGDVLVAAGMFTFVRDIVQYHLGASDPTHTERHAASKLLFDTVRRWATERRAYVFHLGGGVGARDDSLLHFKSGFSDRKQAFFVWRYIVDTQRYGQAVAAKQAWLDLNHLELADSSYFPAYRANLRRKG